MFGVIVVEVSYIVVDIIWRLSGEAVTGVVDKVVINGSFLLTGILVPIFILTFFVFLVFFFQGFTVVVVGEEVEVTVVLVVLYLSRVSSNRVLLPFVVGAVPLIFSLKNYFGTENT